MRNHLIAVVDAARARFFEVEPSDERAGVRLVEIADLVNPQRMVRDSEVFAESRSGQRREHGGGPRHGVDDGRQSHAEERERGFAAEILAAAATHVQPAGHLLLVAGPEMLGHLRERKEVLPIGVQVAEYARNVTQESPTELRDRLLDEGLIAT
jgi:protein required for attachment to host cells